MTTWDPAQYLQFREARLRPALDLLTWIQPVDPPSLVVDLGCGPGDLTARLAERWPDAQVVGVDSSPSMLAEARRDHPEITWVEADLAAYAPPRRAPRQADDFRDGCCEGHGASGFTAQGL